MIKNIAYFPLQCAKNSRPVMDAVLDVLQASGIQTQENSMTSDAAVIWSVLWHGRMKSNRTVYEHYRQQGKPVIIVEIGALYRGQTWKVSVNNITSQGFYGHHDQLDFDRPRQLGISLATQLNPKPHIVLALQHGMSHQVADMGDMTQWIATTLSSLREHTDRPVVIRPHPRHSVILPPLPAKVTVQQPKLVANTYDSFDMHFDCHAVINYNSGPGIQAAISGVRPVVHHSSLARPVSVHMNDIEQIYNCDRMQWLVEICHTEYTLSEIRKGIWLKRIEPALQ